MEGEERRTAMRATAVRSSWSMRAKAGGGGGTGGGADGEGGSGRGCERIWEVKVRMVEWTTVEKAELKK